MGEGSAIPGMGDGVMATVLYWPAVPPVVVECIPPPIALFFVEAKLENVFERAWEIVLEIVADR